MQTSFFKHLFSKHFLLGLKKSKESVFHLFQLRLLKYILFTAFSLSFVISTSSLLGLYPLGTMYMFILYAYSFLSLITYVLSRRYEAYYLLYVHSIVFSSLLTLAVMLVSVVHDEFRMVWFFLVSFASFMLGGKRYGFGITVVIVLMVLLLFFVVDVHLSVYAVATFMMALLVFNLFAHYFLSKLQHDTQHFETLVLQEVDKRQTQEQVLLRQYRMRSMGEMIDAIAHQWRQPLANGSMILSNMQEELDNKTYLEEKITELQALNTHMSQTIDDFRHLLHDSKNKTIFESHVPIDEVLTLMKNQLKSVNIQYTNRINHKILGYKNELIQVLVTLLSNAVEVLEVRNIQDKKILLISEEKDEMILIHIEDNAGGIDASVQDTLFDPYISTKQNATGTGLGLYIAKIIIEDNMQGKLSVNQGLNGARFTLKIKREL